MKKAFQILLVAVFLYGCQKRQKPTLNSLNGYWEIEKVQLPDQSEKLYNYNQTIDFFELRDSTGIRKKVQPKLDGTFSITKDAQQFILKKENDSLRIYYQTPLASWKETIITVQPTLLLIKNDQGFIYHYKPYKKIQL